MKNSAMPFPIKLIGPKLWSTLSAETLKKGKLPSQVSNLLLKFDRPRYERKYGWQDDIFYNEWKLRSPSIQERLRFESNWSLKKLTLVRKLEETEGFYVDGEPRSFDTGTYLSAACFARLYPIHCFYRVYPYYEWDPTQIQKQVAILNECCMLAVTTHNKRTDDHLTFHKLVSANMRPDTNNGPTYFITLKAYLKGQSSREYVTRVGYSRYAPPCIECFKPVLAPRIFSCS